MAGSDKFIDVRIINALLYMVKEGTHELSDVVYIYHNYAVITGVLAIDNTGNALYSWANIPSSVSALAIS